jgi:phenol 2-monooxygenase (NADPH)
MNLLLTRYGLRPESLLCIDAKPSIIKSGQADGLHGRTLEVIKSLNIADEILNEGCQSYERAIWAPNPPESTSPGIQHVSISNLNLTRTRVEETITIHQGRIKRILEEDLLKYSGRGAERSDRLLDVRVDEQADPEFPVLATIEHKGHQRKVRAKHLVGADGAHSVVRRAMDIQMEGDATEDIWGVVDFVADTNFPDIRRVGILRSDIGGILLMPWERKSTGDYLTRLYVSTLKIYQNIVANENGLDGDTSGRQRRSQITPETILKQVGEIMHPYHVKPKKGTEVEWWTAYQVGQRVAQKFVQKDSKGVPRVFIVGDGIQHPI